jgi:redox-sensitive bicupin YhaK (pirin superfamily)
VHSELPSDKFMQEGGTMHGFQIWVNLPAKDKMVPVRYQDISKDEIPKVSSEDEKVRVTIIAGEAMGQKAVIDTHTPIIYLHYTVSPGGSVEQAIPSDHNVLVYVVSGEAILGTNKRKVTEGQLATMSTGDTVQIRNAENAKQDVDLLILAGIPIGEPLVRYGPFVMNTEDEIRQAVDDYRNGRMGMIE